MVLLTCWQQIGYMMIIYIAGLQGLPGDVIEAAAVDGANSRQTLFNVTIPLMMPSITVCTFLTVTNGFKMFDQNLALTNGAPSNSSELLALNIYRTFYGRAGFEGVGQAKAAGVLHHRGRDCPHPEQAHHQQGGPSMSDKVKHPVFWTVFLSIVSLAWV